MYTRKGFLLFLAIASFVFKLYADFGEFEIDYGSGCVLTPVKNNDIVMEEADIRIIAREFSPDFEYTCNFRFKNITSKSQTIVMGFPVRYDVIKDRKNPNTPYFTHTDSYIEDFKVEVNGKTQQCEKYAELHESGEEGEKAFTDDLTDERGEKISPAGRTGVYNEIHTFKVVFKPKEEKKISAGFHYIIREKPGKPLENEFDSVNFINHLHNTRNIVHYILTTGGLWAEPIGNLKVAIEFTGIPYELFAWEELKPLGFNQKPYNTKIPNAVVLTLEKKNYRPERDVEIVYSPKNISKVLREYIRKKNYRRLEELLDYCYYCKDTYGGDSIDGWFREGRDLYSGGFQDREFIINQRFALYDAIDGDTTRFADFRLANHLIYTNFTKAIQYYQRAFRHIRNYVNFVITDPDLLLKHSLHLWEKEKANDAPCYYIAYNMACVYAMKGELTTAEKWLRIAIRLEPELIKKHMKNDKDLTNLRSNNVLFNELLTREPQVYPGDNEKMADIRDVFDRYKSGLAPDSTPVTVNKLEFIPLLERNTPYAAAVYYETKQECVVEVKLISFNSLSYTMKIAGIGKGKAHAGRDCLLIPVIPVDSYEDFPDTVEWKWRYFFSADMKVPEGTVHIDTRDEWSSFSIQRAAFRTRLVCTSGIEIPDIIPAGFCRAPKNSG